MMASQDPYYDNYRDPASDPLEIRGRRARHRAPREDSDTGSIEQVEPDSDQYRPDPSQYRTHYYGPSEEPEARDDPPPRGREPLDDPPSRYRTEYYGPDDDPYRPPSLRSSGPPPAAPAPEPPSGPPPGPPAGRPPLPPAGSSIGAALGGRPQTPYEQGRSGLFDDEDDWNPRSSRTPAPPSEVSGYRHAGDEYGDSTGTLPQAYEPPVPRRVDLPDDVFAPRGTGGRRLAEPEDDFAPREPFERRQDEPRPSPGPFDEPRPGGERFGDSRPGDERFGAGRSPEDRYGGGRYGEPRRGEPLPGDPRYGDPRYGDPRYDERGAGRSTAVEEDLDEGSEVGPAIGIGIGVAIGLGLAASGALGGPFTEGTIGSVGAAIVVAMLTAVVVRRGLGPSWWVSGLAGMIPAALVLAAPLGPSWAASAMAIYAAGAAGAAAILLTAPVRKLSELVLEYIVSVGLAFAGGGAVAGIMHGSSVGRGGAAIAIVLGFTITLAVAGRARVRLPAEAPSSSDKLYYAFFVVAAVIGAASLAVLLGAGNSFLGRAAAKAEGMLLDFRLIVILPLAILGSAVMVRAFTSAGWWVCSISALSTSAMAAAFGGSVKGERRIDIAPTLASAFVGYVLGFLVTVAVAFFIGMRMRTAASRARRTGGIPQVVEEPGRLAAL